jgi:hypothetical protein
MAWNESCIPVEVVNVKLISVIFYTKWSIQTVILARTMVFCSALMLCSAIPVYLVGTVIRASHIHYSQWHEPSVQCTLLHPSVMQYMPRTLQPRSSFTCIHWWAFFLGMCSFCVEHYQKPDDSVGGGLHTGCSGHPSLLLPYHIISYHGISLLKCGCHNT